jgi:hypothetical protein
MATHPTKAKNGSTSVQFTDIAEAIEVAGMTQDRNTQRSLAKRTDKKVLMALSANPSLYTDVLEDLIRRTNEPEVLQRLAQRGLRDEISLKVHRRMVEILKNKLPSIAMKRDTRALMEMLRIANECADSRLHKTR